MAQVLLYIEAAVGLVFGVLLALGLTALGLLSAADAPGPRLGQRLGVLFAILLAGALANAAALAVVGVYLGRPGRRWAWSAAAALQALQFVPVPGGHRHFVSPGLALALTALVALLTPSALRFHWRARSQ